MDLKHIINKIIIWALGKVLTYILKRILERVKIWWLNKNK